MFPTMLADSINPVSTLPISNASLSDRLRRAIGQEQGSFEDIPGLRRLMSRDLSLEGYVDILRNWRRCWPFLEMALEAEELNDTYKYLAVSRRRELRDDLKVLGVASSQIFPENILPNFHSYRWLGGTYVLKRVQIGNAIAFENIYRSLGLRSAGASFIQLPGAADLSVASHWGRWCKKLDKIALKENEIAQAIQASQDTARFINASFS